MLHQNSEFTSGNDTNPHVEESHPIYLLDRIQLGGAVSCYLRSRLGQAWTSLLGHPEVEQVLGASMFFRPFGYRGSLHVVNSNSSRPQASGYDTQHGT